MRLPWPFSLFRKDSAAGPASHRSGAWGERIAAEFLESHGYRILGRNVRFGSRCELDLVARSPAPEALVFVEVKTRSGDAFGSPGEAVDARKQRHLVQAGAFFLQRFGLQHMDVRFDVVEVRIHHIQGV